jgi:hypothetical protein
MVKSSAVRISSLVVAVYSGITIGRKREAVKMFKRLEEVDGCLASKLERI